jgi:microcystin-dependent protein
MSYTLTQTDGEPVLVLADGIVNTDKTSISLIGKNVSNFGDAQNENFLHMLEHFSNVSQPKGDLLKGQIWYNKNDRVLRPSFYDGTNWRPMAVLLYSNTTTDTLINASGQDFAANKQGDLWFDSVNKQLHIVTGATGGTVTTLIGPESVDGFGASRLQSVRMTDTVGTSYPVIHMTVDGEVIGMISPSTFTPNTATIVTGFTQVYRGITLKNYNPSSLYTTATTDVQLHGLHEQLDTTFVRRNVDEHIQSDWSFDNSYSLNFGTTAQSSISWNTSTTTLTLQSNTGIRLESVNKAITFNSGTLLPSDSTINLGNSGNLFSSLYVSNVFAGNIVSTATDTYSLGTTGTRWNQVFAVSVNGDRIVANTATITTLTATNLQSINHVSNRATVSELTATTLSFGNLKDSITTATVSRIDTDGTLSSNSDANLSTQKAIKTYIDTIRDTLLQQLGDLSTVPTGSVFYIVQSTAPTGYLVCDGSLHSITSYPSLFAAIQYSYGGSGSTFRLPDLRGEFIRGVDGGRGIDSSRTLGSAQGDAIASHSHSASLSGSAELGGSHTHSASSAVTESGHHHLMPGDDQLSFANGAAGWPARSAGGFSYDARSGAGGGAQVWLTSDSTTGITVATSLSGSPTHTHSVSVSGSTSETGGTETRPRNVALTPIIKT